MNSLKQNIFSGIKKSILEEKKIIRKMMLLLTNLNDTTNIEERKIVLSQIISLKESLKKTNENISDSLEKISLPKPLPSQVLKKSSDKKTSNKLKTALSDFEKETLKRLKKKEIKKEKEKSKKPSMYIKLANRFFSEISINLLNKNIFKNFYVDLPKANMNFLPKTYVSIILFTTIISFFISIFIFLFFLFFNIGSELPIITKANEGIGTRILKIFWILLVVPLGTFLTEGGPRQPDPLLPRGPYCFLTTRQNSLASLLLSRQAYCRL